ncbi:ankyrin repeat-containing domain protein, partial [Lentinula raphanica]
DHSNDKKEKEQILEWLAAPDCFTNLRTALNKRVTGTSQWILEDSAYKNWMEKAGIWWIQGKAGSGKTFLITYTIKNLQDTTSANSVVYHYFDTCDNTRLKTSYQGMLLFLMLQLGAQNQNIHPALKNLFQSSICGISHLKPTNIQLLDTLKKIIRDLFQHKHQVYIIIDALDECEDSHLVLDFIREMTHFSWLRIIISSRDHPPEALACFTTFLSNHNSIKEDIAIFVKNQMHLKFKNPSLEIEVRNKLLEKADGGFWYIDCQLQVINRCAISRKVETALATLPLDLRDTYSNVIASYNSEDDLEYLYHLIIWLLYSFEPVYLNQVATLFSIDLKSQTVASNTDLLTGIETIVDSTLITVDSHNIVQFAHASVKEFLLQSHEDNHNKRVFNLNAHLAHDIMTQMCLIYLLHHDYDVLKKRLSLQVSFRQYATDNWAKHSYYNEKARVSSEDTMNLAQNFLDTSSESFLKWKNTYHFPHGSLGMLRPNRNVFKYCNALHIVAFFGLYQNAQKLLSSEIYKQQNKLKADLNAVGKYVGTPLHVATYMGHRDIIELLLEHNADVNAICKIGTPRAAIEETAIECAIHKGYKEIVEILLEHGAELNLNAQQINLAFDTAGYMGHKEMLEFLFQCNAIKAQEHDLNTAFLIAAQAGHKDIVEFFLKNNINVNVQDDYFETALQAAACRDHKAIIQLLLDYGANVNANKGRFGTALQIAASHNNQDIVKLLIDHSADINACDEYQGTPLQIAISYNHQDMAQLLIKYGADIS